MKIRYKLSAIVIALIVTSVLTVGIGFRQNAVSLSRQLSLGSLEHMSSYWIATWEGNLSSDIRVLRTLADVMGDFGVFPTEIRRDTFDEMMESVVAATPIFFGVNVLWLPDILDNDADNIGRTGTIPETGQHGSAFIRELAGGAIEHRTLLSPGEMMSHMLGPNARADNVGAPEARSVPGRGDVWVMRISVPIIARHTGQVVAMLSALIDLALIQPQLASYFAGNPQLERVTMYFNNGHIIASSNPEVLNTNVSDWPEVWGESIGAVVQTIAAGQNLQGSYFSPAVGENLELMLDSFPIGENSGAFLSIMITQTESTIMAPINAMIRNVALIGLLLLAVVVAVSITFFGKATKPLTWLHHEIGVLAQGDFQDVDLYKYSGKDEIADLIEGFHATQKSVKELINKVKSESQSLSGIGETLSTNMTQTAAAVNEITSNVQSVKTRVVNQSASVDQTSATMKQLVQNIDRLDGFISDQSTYVSTASSAVEEMAANIRSVTDTLVKNGANVKHLMEAAEMGRNGINEVATDIQEIARESEGLMEINTVMENIASQTNLLSMNAAIEAARAGESGKGFSVVAGEVRKLAESSKEQSQTIGEVLKKIKTSIDKISRSNENVLNKFKDIEAEIKIVSDQEENILRAMEEQDVGSRQIVNGIIEITEITRKVKNGSSEMLVGANEVIRETGNLENVTREIKDSMNEMAAGTNQINSAVNHVNDISTQNRSAIGVLMQEVSQFKV